MISKTWLAWMALGALIGVIAASAQGRQCEPRWMAEEVEHQPNAGISAMRAWDPDGRGPQGEVLVVGGSFNSIGGIQASRIAAWDGVNWQAIGEGATENVLAISEFEGYLLMAPLHGVYRWDGANWESMNLIGQVRAFANYNGQLYAGGWFPPSQGYGVIRRWEGSQWQLLSNDIEANFVTALHVFQGELIAGGSLILNPPGGPGNYIAAWSGSTWRALGGGTNAKVAAFDLYNDALIAAGDFSIAGGVVVNYISRWDGSRWSALAGGLPGPVQDLAVHNGTLIAAGSSDQNGIYLMQWDGSNWKSIRARFGIGSLRQLKPFKGELIAGGQSFLAQEEVLLSFARWTDTNVPWIAQQPQDVNATCIGSASFTVAPASGYDGLSYQWQKDGSPIFDGPTKHGSIISGAKSASLTISNAQLEDAGAYDVIVSNDCGQAVSDPATLIVNTCGDVNGDHVVNVSDLLAVIDAWGACPPAPQTCAADIAPPPGGNGVVNVGDLLLVINTWG